MRRTALLAAAVVTVLLAAPGPARAHCFGSSKPYHSGFLATPGFSFPGFYITSLDIDGVWWMLGHGDPEPGRGLDSGLFPGGGCGYDPGCWIQGQPYSFDGEYFLYYPAVSGTWRDPRIDGCLDNEPLADCLVALLSDEKNEVGYFALVTAPEGATSFTLPGADLAAIPPPPVTSVTDGAGTLRIDLGPVSTPASGINTQPACSAGLVQGFKVYQQVRGPGQLPPSGRRRDDGDPAAGWELAVGGAGPGSAPLPDGSSGRITATGCLDGGTLHLATGLVFEGGFETPHVSRDGTPVACGSCVLVDGDADTFRGDKCAARASFDCDDTAAAVFPGAPQICDGANNDCGHPRWPLLEGTGEIDDDGDGASGCAGDPCPLDAGNDADGDGLCADLDNCPAAGNPGQEDADGDGAGDVCDVCPGSAVDDTDHDGLCGDADNCPITYNPQQTDDDGDLAGNVCDRCPFDADNDIDGDGICGDVDVCPLDRFNDFDHDGLCAGVDPCPFDTFNDADGDGVCGDVDNCPVDFNPGQPDADGDGNGDLCDRFALPVVVTSAGTIVERQIGVASGDIDGDGDTDIVAYGAIATFTETQLYWIENLGGDGMAWSRHLVTVVTSPTAAHVQTGDLNGDGRLDIATGKGWFLNARGDGTQWVPQSLGSAAGGEITLVDLDADGDLDVLAPTASGLEWHENLAGSGDRWSVRTIFPMLGTDATPADVDRDGDTDILARGRRDAVRGFEYLWFENTDGEATIWEEHVIAGGVTSFGMLSGGDVDRDGDTDLMATDGGLHWFENADATGGAWQQHTIAGSGQPPFYIRVVAVDIDRDGDLDALTSRERTVGIDWHENVDGHGGAWKVRVIRSNTSAGNALVTGAFMADVDTDGFTDAIGTGVFLGSLTPARIEWYRNLGTITADAGPDQTLLCTGPGGAIATLDGSGSASAGSGPLTWTWTGPFGTIVSGSPTADASIPPGAHVVNLMVQASSGISDEDSLLVTVRPGLSVAPAVLWPPNHRMIDVTATLTGCPAAAILASVASSEPDDAPGGMDGMTTRDIQGAVTGTADTQISLRAERSATGDGRVYTIIYETTAGAGQPAQTAATVSVPADMAGGPDPLTIAVEESPAGTVLSWPGVPGALSYAAIRGHLGALRPLPDRVDAGGVVCLQTGPATSTIGSEDAAIPPAGEAWFYAVGYDDGVLRSSYGTAEAALPLTVTSGDCPD